MIDQALLHELVDYDRETGHFIWRQRNRVHFSTDRQFKTWNRRYPGMQAGSLDAKGYRAMRVRGQTIKAHKLAWMYVYGHWPAQQIDHVNGDRDDNRIENLRDVSNATNGKNRRLDRRSKTGRIGVTAYPWNGRVRYVARIRVDGHLHHLGYFDTISDAAASREAAELEFGFHANHGTPPTQKLKSRPFPKRWEGRS